MKPAPAFLAELNAGAFTGFLADYLDDIARHAPQWKDPEKQLRRLSDIWSRSLNAAAHKDDVAEAWALKGINAMDASRLISTLDRAAQVAALEHA
jgi:hypothetical protein